MPLRDVISVIIPTYNRVALLLETVESVRAQTFTEFELIIVDDGSTDGTCEAVEAIAADDRRIRLVRAVHGGVCRARNLGYGVSDPAAESVVFLDSDDVWEPDALETLSKALANDPEAVAAHGLADIVDKQGRRVGPGDPWMIERPAVVGGRVEALPMTSRTTFSAMAVRNCIQTLGLVLVRRSAFERAGLFDESFTYLGDYDMWLRLLLVGDFAFVPRNILHYRVHDGNETKRRGQLGIDEGQYSVTARRKLQTRSSLTPEQQLALAIGYRHMQRAVARLRFRWAWGCLTHGDLYKAAKQLRHACIEAVRGQRGLMSRGVPIGHG